MHITSNITLEVYKDRTKQEFITWDEHYISIISWYNEIFIYDPKVTKKTIKSNKENYKK